MAVLEFYFDFSSPYGYLASEVIEALAGRYGREVRWHPILLGAVFKTTGAAPLTSVPLKGDYARRDFARSARYMGIDRFHMPSRFPISSQAPARIALWTEATNPRLVAPVVHALFRAFFDEDVDISDPERAADVAAGCGVDRAAARTAVDEPAMKDALRRGVEEAMERGVCGSPFVIVDGEPFWGADKLPQVERWLQTGGF